MMVTRILSYLADDGAAEGGLVILPAVAATVLVGGRVEQRRNVSQVHVLHPALVVLFDAVLGKH